MNISPSSSSVPPESNDPNTILQKLLSKEDRERLNNARKESLIGAGKGFLFGGVLGFTGYQIAHFIPQLKNKLHRNHLVAGVLVTGAAFSYIFSVVKGQNSMMFMYDVFRKGPQITSTDSDSLVPSRVTSYQATVLNNEREQINQFEDAFHRRAEAIRQTKNQGSDNSGGKSW